ncbi:MAG: CRISPR-associated helicase Cas3' [Eubacteriales bacterium]|nr:CRISPR-associated helicase Cas3' [Eubacteriales bacterium]
MEFLAHISDDGRKQTVQEHLEGTARLCSEFAAEFDAAEQGYLAGISHDIGKYTEAFQRRLHGGPKVDHATAGAIECANAGSGQAAVCVMGHHSGLPDLGNIRTDQPGDATFYGRIKKGLMGGIEPYKGNWPGKLPKTAPAPASARSGFSGAAWTRMLYSCLVDADYLDTERFMQPYKLSRGSYDGMERLLGKLEKHIEKWANPENEMNKYRWEILSECLRCGEKPKGIYTLTVPTGGGKTVSSMAFALRHAVAHGMKHIIYVIPYTSIIEQNAEVFKEILGEDNVLEHHSGKLYELEDVSSPAQYRLAMATENWDMPVIVTTAVQFFESFYSNRSSKCRKLHNLANSVIIFDEAQMLPTCHLQPCVGAIAELVRHFGATAVLCTATQPVLGDIFKRFGWSENIPELCPGTQALYEKFRRVSFRNAGELSNEMLAGELKNSRQALCIVNSRRAAQEIYDILPKEGTYHLSTLMYPAHRHWVLNEIRQRLKEGAVCRVLSTSLIEAGVDVDFPTVYREMAGLDSILQAAGRCNR